MRTELEIQQWLQAMIAADKFVSSIDGRPKIQEVLKQQRSSEFWPEFPIDYLARLRVLETADGMLDELHDLDPVSTIPDSQTANNLGKPDAGKPPVRFDAGAGAFGSAWPI